MTAGRSPMNGFEEDMESSSRRASRIRGIAHCQQEIYNGFAFKSRDFLKHKSSRIIVNSILRGTISNKRCVR